MFCHSMNYINDGKLIEEVREILPNILLWKSKIIP